MIPERGAFCGSKRKGPTKKNLLVPNALAQILSKNVNIGHAWMTSVNLASALPKISFGKNPSKAMMIANDMWT